MDNKIDSLNAIRAFVRVAQAGSFSAAADNLGIPKTTASALVQRLERNLGTALLHRTTRSVRVTDAGARFLEKSVAVLEALDAAEAAVLQHSEVRGQLVVEAPVTLAREFLAPRLPAFMRLHPEVALIVRVENRFADLIADGVDVALRVGKPPAGEVRALRIGSFRGGLTAAASYVAARGCPTRAQDLPGHSVVAGRISGRQLHWTLRNGSETFELRQRPRLATNEIGLAFEAIAAGEGIGWLPDELRADGLLSGQLVEILPAWSLDTALELWLIYLERRQRSPPVSAFIEFIQQQFGDAVRRAA